MPNPQRCEFFVTERLLPPASLDFLKLLNVTAPFLSGPVSYPAGIRKPPVDGMPDLAAERPIIHTPHPRNGRDHPGKRTSRAYRVKPPSIAAHSLFIYKAKNNSYICQS
jgi:hypothetical protein